MKEITEHPASDGLPAFTLERKNVKRINARITADNRLVVSAPPSASTDEILRMLRSHSDWISTHMQKKALKVSSRPELRDGGSMIIAGREYPLRVVSGRRNSCVFSGNQIVMTLKSAQDAQKTADAFLKKQAEELFAQSLERMYPLVKAKGAPKPALKIRKMTSRWGVCATRDKVITMNLCLARAPLPLIDSVMLHELVHLLEPSHNERFHAISAQLMPDYKNRRRLLNALDIIY